MRRAAPTSLLLMLLLCGDMAREPGVAFTWQTLSEINVAGFIVERADSPDGPFVAVSPLIQPGEDPFIRHEYAWLDRQTKPGRTYLYQLVSITNANERLELGRIATTAR